MSKEITKSHPESKNLTDPVCGMTVKFPPKFSTKWNGELIGFCSPHCLKQFQTYPKKFAKSNISDTLERKSLSIPKDAAGLTCPMHPEIFSKTPGSCPICGMALEPVRPSDNMENPELNDFQKRFWWGLLFTVPIFLLSMTKMLVHLPLSNRGVNFIELILSLPVIFYSGKPLFLKGWQSIISKNLNMFTLIALGTGLAAAYSFLATLAPGLFPDTFRQHGELSVYFESATVIITLVLLGQVMELQARQKTGQAIQSLMKLAPKEAAIVHPNGKESIISIEDIKPEDTFRIKPGEKIPVDGHIIEGNGILDESMMTGEPTPVKKSIGDPVWAGTINTNGSFIFKTEKIGQETILGQIIQMVSAAQRSKAPIQRLADRVSAIFVPLVIGSAALTYTFWALWGPEPKLAHALLNAVAVLIIACPCALGLATPMAVMVGVGRGAQKGVLFRNAEALEALGKVRTVVLDKTGTITEGRPHVVSLIPIDTSEDELIQWAASLESQSEHPLGKAVVKLAQERNVQILPVQNFQNHPGLGISGEINERTVSIGNKQWIENLTAIPQDLLSGANEWGEKGQTVIFISVENNLKGLIGIADPIKNSAVGAIRFLKDEGISVVMLTGDSPLTAHGIAKTLGIQEVISGVLPKDKGHFITQLKKSKGPVAMVGDGINDAPALASADVGIAMGKGTDVAIQTASVTLLNSQLDGVISSFKLSRRTMAIIKQNLFFAFFYNLLGVPLAAGLLYPLWGVLLSPMFAAAAMSFSSVSVILNSLRLRRSVSNR